MIGRSQTLSRQGVRYRSISRRVAGNCRWGQARRIASKTASLAASSALSRQAVHTWISVLCAETIWTTPSHAPLNLVAGISGIQGVSATDGVEHAASVVQNSCRFNKADPMRPHWKFRGNGTLVLSPTARPTDLPVGIGLNADIDGSESDDGNRCIGAFTPRYWFGANRWKCERSPCDLRPAIRIFWCVSLPKIPTHRRRGQPPQPRR